MSPPRKRAAGIAVALTLAVALGAVTAGADERASQPGGKCRGEQPTIVGENGDDLASGADRERVKSAEQA